MVESLGGDLNSFVIQYTGSNDGSTPTIQVLTRDTRCTPYGNYHPVYLNFNGEYLIVKGRTPVNPYSNVTKQKEAMFLYAFPDVSAQPYWGLTPNQYYLFKDQSNESETRFDTTPSLPLILSEGSLPHQTKIYFTQNPADQNTFKHRSTQSRQSKFKGMFRELFPMSPEMKSSFHDSSQIKLFQVMDLTYTRLKLKKMVYKDLENSTALILNKNTGAIGAHTALVPFINIFGNLKPKPLPSTSNAFDKLPLWLLIVFVIGVVLLIVFVFICIKLIVKKSRGEEDQSVADSSINGSKPRNWSSMAKIHLFHNIDERSEEDLEEEPTEENEDRIELS